MLFNFTDAQKQPCIFIVISSKNLIKVIPKNYCTFAIIVESFNLGQRTNIVYIKFKQLPFFDFKNIIEIPTICAKHAVFFAYDCKLSALRKRCCFKSKAKPSQVICCTVLQGIS